MKAETVNSNVEKILALAEQVMKLSRNALIIKLRFMDSAIANLRCIPVPAGSFAVDGIHILYEPVHTLRLYGGGPEQISRAYLHMVLHCVFRHFFVDPSIDQRLWDLACDIAVESVIAELDIPELSTARDTRQRSVISDFHRDVKIMTAEKIYHYLRENPSGDALIDELSQLFQIDDHSMWYRNNDTPESGEGGSDGEPDEDGDREPNADAKPGSGENGEQNGSENKSEAENNLEAASRRELEQRWKDISERMQTDLETLSRKQGDKAGRLIQNLTALNREKYDYESFLKKFAVMGEAMRVNDDEFDYIFYSYGMRLFPEKRMPLIEPLEYKDVKRIREFVIAIDTSGSVQGALVQRFIQKTYNILQSTDSFFSRINLHIIQCDSEIQEDILITNRDEFDEHLRHMKLKGFGGTDFRPVFKKVAELQRAGAFTNLKGLIYFTDGYGTFPARKPPYETAFVFVDDDYGQPEVPAWAIRLVLGKEEIEG